MAPQEVLPRQEQLGLPSSHLAVFPLDSSDRQALALGLLLDGQADRAEEVLSELMKGASREDACDDVFMHVLALLELEHAAREARETLRLITLEEVP